MGTVAVDVKWQKEVFMGVEIDMSQPPIVFKNQLFSLTGVAPERQKVMVKGGMLKDDQEWAKAGIKPGAKLMMMGTADAVPQAPTAQQVFMEDLPEDEQDVTGLGHYGAGLENLGNTCYMNSTLQCFYGVPELRSAVASYALAPSSGDGPAPGARLAAAARDLFKDLQRSAQPVPPLAFWLGLRAAFPQFNQHTNAGGFAQQDAEECWTQLMYSLRSIVADPAQPDSRVVDSLFGVKLHTSLKCEESGESIEEDTTAYSLKCNISIEVNDLAAGMKLALKDDREKRSEILGHTALYAGGSAIAALPPYLTVQMVRFFYKADVQQKAKILRKVAFPLQLDAYEFATPELKAQLDGPRSVETAAEDERDATAKRQKREAAEAADAKAAKAAADKKAGSSRPNAGAAAATAAAAGPTAATVGTAASEAATSAGGDTAMADVAADAAAPSSSVAELRAKHAGQKTGRYDLTAVLTHKGRSADSGHYVAWVKQPDGKWIQFDDDKASQLESTFAPICCRYDSDVYPAPISLLINPLAPNCMLRVILGPKTAQMIVRKEEEVLSLSGGGDWHMAYLLLYRARTLEP